MKTGAFRIQRIHKRVEAWLGHPMSLCQMNTKHHLMLEQAIAGTPPRRKSDLLLLSPATRPGTVTPMDQYRYRRHCPWAMLTITRRDGRVFPATATKIWRLLGLFGSSKTRRPTSSNFHNRNLIEKSKRHHQDAETLKQTAHKHHQSNGISSLTQGSQGASKEVPL